MRRREFVALPSVVGASSVQRRRRTPWAVPSRRNQQRRGATFLRTFLPLLAACVLAGCSQAPPQIKSSAPTVTYQVTGNDVSEANAKAQNFCARYNTHALFEGVQATSWGKVAVYRCDSAAPGAGAPPPPPSGSTVVRPPPPSGSTAVGPPRRLTPPVQ